MSRFINMAEFCDPEIYKVIAGYMLKYSPVGDRAHLLYNDEAFADWVIDECDWEEDLPPCMKSDYEEAPQTEEEVRLLGIRVFDHVVEALSDDDLAISLFDGGWRPDDAALMAANYEECSIEMARIICERMQELIDAGRLKGSE